jgi:S-adenosylmethionine:tRNA ribosyltransferase-isomerase
VTGSARLLVVDPASEAWAHARFDALPELLQPADVVVVNDAATLPASLPARLGDAVLELRLVAAPETPCGTPDCDGGRFAVVVLGAGDWRTRTEDRPPPPPVPVGASLAIGAGADAFTAIVAAQSPISPRLVWLDPDRHGEALWRAIYAAGRPVQYAHVPAPYHLWDVQTPYAGRPWAVEMPSAGRPLSWDVLGRLRARGVRVVALTHAAGLSATGDRAIDAALPLPEAYDLPAATVAAIEDARARGGRVVAIGTSVVRALEGAALAGALRAGGGVTDLRIHPAFQPRIVDAVVSGIHPDGESHHALLGAFAGPMITPAMRAAIADGYREHEHGDASIVLPGALDRLAA